MKVNKTGQYSPNPCVSWLNSRRMQENWPQVRASHYSGYYEESLWQFSYRKVFDASPFRLFSRECRPPFSSTLHHIVIECLNLTCTILKLNCTILKSITTWCRDAADVGLLNIWRCRCLSDISADAAADIKQNAFVFLNFLAPKDSFSRHKPHLKDSSFYSVVLCSALGAANEKLLRYPQ